jgi:hypothetical protein
MTHSGDEVRNAKFSCVPRALNDRTPTSVRQRWSFSTFISLFSQELDINLYSRDISVSTFSEAQVPFRRLASRKREERCDFSLDNIGIFLLRSTYQEALHLSSLSK